jgi:hypothetical protein
MNGGPRQRGPRKTLPYSRYSPQKFDDLQLLVRQVRRVTDGIRWMPDASVKPDIPETRHPVKRDILDR